MRQLLIQVPEGKGQKILDIAHKYNGSNLSILKSTAKGGPEDIVIVHISNSKVEGFLSEIQDIPDLQITLIPRGVIVLKPPPGKAADQAIDVEHLSPVEVFLGGLQSVGSWKTFLGYSFAAGMLAWTGLFTNTVYLLTASMLIAPFAGPAMNAAIATARGDRELFARNIFRYIVALAVAIVISALFSMIMGQEIATSQMVDISKLSSINILIPLIGGAAGAFALVQSERSSLVSGAAIGLLVSASLAPPAGLVGMSIAIGRWDMVRNGLFILLLTVICINIAGAAVFRGYGMSTEGARYNRGKKWVSYAITAIAILMVLGLLIFQISGTPAFERSTREERATAEIRDLLKEVTIVDVVDVNARFTRPDIERQNILLCLVYVEKKPGVDISSSEIEQMLIVMIQDRLLKTGFDITPLVDVTVLERPSMTEYNNTGMAMAFINNATL